MRFGGIPGGGGGIRMPILGGGGPGGIRIPIPDIFGRSGGGLKINEGGNPTGGGGGNLMAAGMADGNCGG